MTDSDPSKNPIWHDEAEQVTVPGSGSGSIELGVLKMIFEHQWALASWLPADACKNWRELGGEEHLVDTKVWPWQPDLPKTVERIPEGWDHDHCCASFCGAYVHRRGEPEEAVAYYCAETDNWLCRDCRDAIEAHRDALLKGLKDRGVID